jgi:hypothetical protein
VGFFFLSAGADLASPSSASLRFFCLTGFYVHFFCSSKRNEPKKKRPEMITSAFFSARYTSLIGATKKAEVRTISGLPTHHHLVNSVDEINYQYF